MTDPKDAGPVEQELPDEDLDAVTGAGTNVAGTYGTFSLDSAGAWTYTANEGLGGPGSD